MFPLSWKHYPVCTKQSLFHSVVLHHSSSIHHFLLLCASDNCCAVIRGDGPRKTSTRMLTRGKELQKCVFVYAAYRWIQGICWPPCQCHVHPFVVFGDPGLRLHDQTSCHHAVCFSFKAETNTVAKQYYLFSAFTVVNMEIWNCKIQTSCEPDDIHLSQRVFCHALCRLLNLSVPITRLFEMQLSQKCTKIALWLWPHWLSSPRFAVQLQWITFKDVDGYRTSAVCTCKHSECSEVNEARVSAKTH